MHVEAGFEQRERRCGDARAVALDDGLEAERVARRHDCDAVPADVAAEDDGVARAHTRGQDGCARDDAAQARGIDEETVRVAAVHDLGIARHEPHAGRIGRRAHRFEEAPQHRERQALLDDEPDGETQRPRPAHGKIVDRAVHGQRADVSAREHERTDDVGVGRERDRTAGIERRAVVALVQFRIAEGRPDERFEQTRHGASAAAVRELDDVFVAGRQRAIGSRAHGDSAGSRRAARKRK